MVQVGRRTFLSGAAAAAAGVLLPEICMGMGRRQQDRPNLLVCVADDWSYGFASLYGDKAARTPAFDRLAEEGVSFNRAFCIAPTCSAARAGILTGQPPHRLEQAANLWGTLPAKFPVYPDLLEAAGYVVGRTGKGYGPAILGDRSRDAAGPDVESFGAFLDAAPADRPFCFWFGGSDPHRPYDHALARSYWMNAAHVQVPSFLPDVPEVREDLLDYCAEIRRFDAELEGILASLDASGRAANTLVVVTTDNGMPFPRAKANLYDAATRVPLVIRFPGVVTSGQTRNMLVSHLDLVPTFLELAGVAVPPAVAGESLLSPLTGGNSGRRRHVFFERERHGRARKDNLGYPSRAIRTHRHLLIRNLASERWPAGDPRHYITSSHFFADIDSGPSKAFLLLNRDSPAFVPYFQRACGKRPAIELYDVIADPWQMTDLADAPEYAAVRDRLDAELTGWMTATADPRADGGGEEFDLYPYYGKPRAHVEADG